ADDHADHAWQYTTTHVSLSRDSSLCRTHVPQRLPLGLAGGVEAAGIRHRYIQPRGPSRTGKLSAAIGSITRNSGAGMTSAASLALQAPSASGSMRTSTNAPRSAGPYTRREARGRAPAIAASA